MIQKDVLEAIGSTKLKVYFVWLPILGNDNVAAAA